MKNLTCKRMNDLQGGENACLSMVLSFGGAVASSFLGPAGIGLGAGFFLRGVSHAADCEKEGW